MGIAIKKNRASEEQLYNKLITGVPAHLTAAFQMNGQTVQPQDLVTSIQAALQADIDLDAALLAAQQKRQVRDLASSKARALVVAFHAYVVGIYGKTNPILADFGFSPSPSRVPSVVVKAIAQAKSLATRAARHTMGSAEKAKIHGNVAPPSALPQNGKPTTPTST